MTFLKPPLPAASLVMVSWYVISCESACKSCRLLTLIGGGSLDLLMRVLIFDIWLRCCCRVSRRCVCFRTVPLSSEIRGLFRIIGLGEVVRTSRRLSDSVLSFSMLCLWDPDSFNGFVCLALIRSLVLGLDLGSRYLRSSSSEGFESDPPLSLLLSKLCKSVKPLNTSICSSKSPSLHSSSSSLSLSSKRSMMSAAVSSASFSCSSWSSSVSCLD
mmetsp:Transcript_31978/g.55120  ORF Transcript_31978/g.55120 Transcript_31978/m.55120 type:complete len:215 (-) Transcript_31978:1849-2493(-)